MTPEISNPAQARLDVRFVAGQSCVVSARSSNPVKLLVPRARGRGVWVYLSTYGGGFVAGDEVELEIGVGAGARCFLTSQALTKIYRNPQQRPCGQRLTAKVESDALLVLAPEPVQAFAESRYTQSQIFHLAPRAGLVLVDSFCSGRAARGERWIFRSLQSRNEIFLNGERVLLDSLLLDSAFGPLGSIHRLGRFNCVALVAIVGESLAAHASTLLTEVVAEPIHPRAPLAISASPLRNGALLRLAGEKPEMVMAEVRRRLGFVADLLQDDPWARKW